MRGRMERRGLWLGLLAVGLAMAGCAHFGLPGSGGDEAAGVVAAAAGMAGVPLIPREVLFGNPDKASARLNKDGTRLAYLAPLEGVLNVWVGPVDEPDAAKPVTHDGGRGIRGFFWAYTGEHIVYVQDEKGDENWRVYSVNVTTGEEHDLTPLEGVQARIQEVSPDFPGEILVGLNDRDARLHDVWRVDLLSGERELVFENPGFAGLITDENFEVRLAYQMTPDGGQVILAPQDGKWAPFIELGMDDSLSSHVAGFDKTGRTLYFVDSRGRDTAALTAIDLGNGGQEVVAANAKADVSDMMVHPTEKTIQAVAFNYTRKEWEVVDEAVAADLDVLRGVSHGDIEIVSRTLDDAKWIAAFLVDDGPVKYYVYDRTTKEAAFLFTNRQALEDQPLVPMHPVVIESRDGLNLVSYVTLPPGSDSDSDGIPDEPLPTVLDVHGGPWHRSSWGYSPGHQWLANRGYAVLDVNFRGSTGFGKAFLNAGNMEWAAAMHNDLIDAVNWAVAQGIADVDQVAIYGASYGGYAALVGLTFTPEVFACSIDVVGPSNLVTLIESIPPYWEPMKALFTTRVGDPATEEGRAFLLSRSPITHVERIERPLLIGQGANDPRVKQAESDQIVAAMQEKEIPVTYVLYPDEGHGFARPENRLSFYAVTEAFLAQHLGGRFEEVGDDFQGSSITVPAGAGGIPQLGPALDAMEDAASGDAEEASEK